MNDPRSLKSGCRKNYRAIPGLTEKTTTSSSAGIAFITGRLTLPQSRLTTSRLDKWP